MALGLGQYLNSWVSFQMRYFLPTECHEKVPCLIIISLFISQILLFYVIAIFKQLWGSIGNSGLCTSCFHTKYGKYVHITLRISRLVLAVLFQWKNSSMSGASPFSLSASNLSLSNQNCALSESDLKISGFWRKKSISVHHCATWFWSSGFRTENSQAVKTIKVNLLIVRSYISRPYRSEDFI